MGKIEYYMEILGKIDRKEMEEFLFENLISDLKLQNRFEMKFAKYFNKQNEKDIIEMFNQEWGDISDRGYISEEMGFEAMHILYDYVHTIEDILEDDIAEGIKYVEKILEAIGDFQIDGSYGEHEDIIDIFKEIIKKIIINSDGKDKEEFINWLNEYIKIKDELYDFKDEFKELIQ